MATPSHPPVDRRQFLQHSALAAGAFSSTDPRRQVEQKGKRKRKKGEVAYKTERVIIIAFAGGVRSKEVLETPENVPNLTRIASACLPSPKRFSLAHDGTRPGPQEDRATRETALRYTEVY